MDIYVDIKKSLPDFNLNIEFEGGKERIGLLGASGSGKSMTLRCIAGLIKPDEGKIIVNGKTFFDSKKGINLKAKERKVGFLFQNYALFPHLTVYENISFGLFGLSQIDKSFKVSKIINKFHLTGLENRYPEQISGGQQQRTALARAIVPEPEIILLDEPFSALDEHLRSNMLVEMLRILKEFEGSTLFVTHNMDEAYRFCDKLALLSQGELHDFDMKKDVFETPRTIEAARITGCKNIVEAIRIDEEYIEIPIWKIKLKTISKTKTKNGFLGIRANHIKLCEMDDSENILSARIVENIESPFGQTVYLKFEGNINNSADYDVQWEVSKNIWDKVDKNSKHIRLVIPKEKVIYLSR